MGNNNNKNNISKEIIEIAKNNNGWIDRNTPLKDDNKIKFNEEEWDDTDTSSTIKRKNDREWQN